MLESSRNGLRLYLRWSEISLGTWSARSHADVAHASKAPRANKGEKRKRELRLPSHPHFGLCHLIFWKVSNNYRWVPWEVPKLIVDAYLGASSEFETVVKLFQSWQAATWTWSGAFFKTKLLKVRKVDALLTPKLIADAYLTPKLTVDRTRGPRSGPDALGEGFILI